MTSEKPGSQAVIAASNGVHPTVKARTLPAERTGQSDVPSSAVQTHTLIILVHERPGAVDRVVGLLRRRRANMHTLTIGRSEQPDVARVTAVTDDAEVSVEQLVEQMRKIIDVQQVLHLSSEHMVERELALIKVASAAQHINEIIALGQPFGAHVVDVSPATITLEVSGDAAKIEQLIGLLQPFGIREVARTGSIALPRDTE